MSMHDTRTDMPNTEIEPRAGRREWIGLAALALPTLLVSIDIFVMLLALLTPARATLVQSVSRQGLPDEAG